MRESKLKRSAVPQKSRSGGSVVVVVVVACLESESEFEQQQSQIAWVWFFGAADLNPKTDLASPKKKLKQNA